MTTTIAVPVGAGSSPTPGSKVFLDECGANYLVRSGGTHRQHTVALAIGVVRRVSNDAASIEMFESHPATDFIEELSQENHLKLVTDRTTGHAHLVLQESPGASGLQESLSTTLQESHMTTTLPKRVVHRALANIINNDSYSPDVKARATFRFLQASSGSGLRRITESVAIAKERQGRELREAALERQQAILAKRMRHVLRGCQRRDSRLLTESAQQQPVNQVAKILRNCK
jgi:hypothetical protein